LASRDRPAKHRALDVLACAGTAVLAFRIDEQEAVPFRISVWMTRKEENGFVRFFRFAGEGSSGLPV